MLTRGYLKSYFLVCFIFLITGVSHAVTLQDGVPYQTSLESMNINDLDISVPTNASKLTVTITGGTGDLDLYLKFGSPLSGSTVGEIDADADASSLGSTADETIILSSSSTPALKPGTWYISVLNWNDATTSFKVTATLEQSSAPPVSNIPSGSAGIPAGAVIISGNEISVIGMNFSNEFDMETINEWQSLGTALFAQLGEQGSIDLYPPDVLLAAGFNGVQLHELIVSALPGLKSYFQVNVTKVNNAQGSSIRLDINIWDADYPSGQFAGAVEIADPLDLASLLGLMSEGSKFIKITTSNSTTMNGDKFTRMEFYYQETATSPSVFLAAVEITEILMMEAFSLLQVAD